MYGHASPGFSILGKTLTQLIHVLDLQRAVINSEILADLRGPLQHFRWISIASNASGHCVFASAKTPHVEIMDLDSFAESLNAFVQSFGVDRLWRALHKNVDAVTERLLASHAHENGEKERARWVHVLRPRVFVGRPDVDHRSSDGNAHAHQQVTQNVKVGGINIDVL